VAEGYFRAFLLCGLVLLPLIPTVVVYAYLKDSASKGRVRGQLVGLKFETAGAMGSYVACLLLALLTYRLVFADSTARVELIISATGDSDKVQNLLGNAEAKTRLVLSRDGSEPITIDHVEVNASRDTLKAEIIVPANVLNQNYLVSLYYSGQQLTVAPSTVLLAHSVNLTVNLGHTSAVQWDALFDGFSYSFRNKANDLYIHEIVLLQNNSGTPLDTIPLHSYLDIGTLVYLEVGARSIEKAEAAGLVQRWSRTALTSVASDSLPASFDKQYDDIKTLGDEIAVRHFTNSDYSLPGEGSRFQRGQVTLDEQRVIPTIGPIEGALDVNKAVAIYVDCWRKTSAQDRRKAVQLSTGATFERSADRVVFLLHSTADWPIDMSSLRLGFKKGLNYSAQPLGNARIQRGLNNAVFDLESLNSDESFQIFWAWK
jgi:hypothetical protein